MGNTILFGGSGFLGNIFLRDYPDIISVGRSEPHGNVNNKHYTVDLDNPEKTLDNIEFDNVIFLVGNSDHHAIKNSCMKGFDHNVIPLKKILYYLKDRDIKKFVSFTSILLYGLDPKGRPVGEQDKIFPYTSEYVFSKYIAEEVCNFYSEFYDIPILNVRLSNIYGDTTLIRPDLIPTLIKDSLIGEPVVWNTKPKRDFIFTSDAASAVMELLKTKLTGNVNIGTGESHSVEEIVSIIEDLSGRKVKRLNKDVEGVMEFCCDIEWLKMHTNWTPKYSLKEGLEKTFLKMKGEFNK